MSYLAQPADASMLYSLEFQPGRRHLVQQHESGARKMPRTLVERIRSLDIKLDGRTIRVASCAKTESSNDPRSSVGTPHPVVIQHPVSGDPAL